MKVFVAGASGAIGRPLVAQLLAAGHEVTGTTRHEDRAAALRSAGARAVVCDLLDAEAARDALAAAAPDVVIDELTSLPQRYDLRDPDFYRANDHVRRVGIANVLAGARAAGVRRYIVQSISFVTSPQGPAVLDEDAPLWTDAPAPFHESVAVVAAKLAATLASELRGASNARAKAEFCWAPAVPSWRDGFVSYLDRDP